MASSPLYKINQRVQERNKAYLGVTNRDIRSNCKKSIEGKIKYKNKRIFTIVGEPTLKEDRLKRKSWIYPLIEEGHTRVHYKTQGMLKPVEDK